MCVIDGMGTMAAAAGLFAAQDGLALTRQLALLAVPRGVVRQRIATGEWDLVAPGLVGIGAVPLDGRRYLRAALLAAGDGVALSHGSAASVHGFDGFPGIEGLAGSGGALTAFAGRHRTSLAGVTVHRSLVLRRTDCLEVGGLLTVSRPVALVQVAAGFGRDACGQALDGMLRAGDSPAWIGRVASRWRRRGVAGPATVLDLLAERVDRPLPRSWFQRLARLVLAEAGLEMEDEYAVVPPGARRPLAELDLALPALRIGVECQSWRWHASPTARAHDARRRRRLRLLGWELVEVWWRDLERIDEVVAEIRYLIDRRLGRTSPDSGC